MSLADFDFGFSSGLFAEKTPRPRYNPVVHAEISSANLQRYFLTTGIFSVLGIAIAGVLIAISTNTITVLALGIVTVLFNLFLLGFVIFAHSRKMGTLSKFYTPII